MKAVHGKSPRACFRIDIGKHADTKCSQPGYKAIDDAAAAAKQDNYIVSRLHCVFTNDVHDTIMTSINTKVW